MRNFGYFGLLMSAAACLIVASDWPMPGGGPQRNGWARSEALLNKDNVKNLKPLYHYRAENQARGLNSLTPPIVNGNLITYRGFKEMLMFGASGDKVFSVDADLNQLIWESKLVYRGDKPLSETITVACPGGLTAPVAMSGSSSASMHFAAEASRTPAVPGGPVRRRSSYFPPLYQSIYPMTPKTLTQLAALYAVSSDGYLHILNSSTGEDLLTPIKFLPPNAKVTSLNIWENTVYATTADHCDGYRNALYAINLLSNEKQVVVFAPEGGGFAGNGGTALGYDGTVYVQVTQMPGDKPGHYVDTVLALNPRDLTVKDSFTPPGDSLNLKDLASPGITPMVFSWMGKEMVAVGGRDGRVYLLDAKSLGGADHHTPVLKSDVFAQRDKNYDGYGFRGAISSWQDIDTQTRWLYLPLSGPAKSAAKLPNVEGEPKDGSILALKLTSENSHPVLQPLWVSQNMRSPAPVIITNGVVFALSTGESIRLAKKNGEPYSVTERQAAAAPAVLYALDALTGRELYTSGNAITGRATGGALAVANGRVYVTAQDSTLYCFGLPSEQLQLTEQ